MSKAVNAGLWYAVSNVTLRAVSIITAPIFTRLLTTADYGQVNNFVTWQNILGSVVCLCLSYSIGRAKIDFKDDFYGFISSIQGLSLFVGMTLLVITMPFLGPLARMMEMDKSLLITMFVLLALSPSMDYLQTRYRYEYRYKENIIISIVHTIGIIGFSLIFILLSELDHRYIARIYGSVVTTVLIAGVCFFVNLRKGRKLYHKAYWKYALKYCLPLIPHGLAMIVLAQIDRIMIIKMVGASEAGLYSFGYSYAIVLSIITNAVMFAWQPWVYEKISEGKHDDVRRSNKKLNQLGLVATFLFILITPEVIMLLGSRPFWPAMMMVSPVITGTLFQLFYQFYSMIEMYCKKTVYVGIGSMVVAILNVVLNYFFIPRYGYVAAAYTTMVSYLLLMIYHWCVYRHIFEWRVMCEGQIASYVLLAIAGSILIPMIYHQYLLRFLMVVGLLSVYILCNKSEMKIWYLRGKEY